MAYVEEQHLRAKTAAGLTSDETAVLAGGYGEDRSVYQRSEAFVTANNESRTVHLGIDLWVPTGTPVHAPYDGTVATAVNNNGDGNYGPTLILQHESPNGNRWFSLYGHLLPQSLDGKAIGQTVKQGDIIGWVGESPSNGGWPPHLHFQIMEGSLGEWEGTGDFPGACARSAWDMYHVWCPDPNLILRLPALQTQQMTDNQ